MDRNLSDALEVGPPAGRRNRLTLILDNERPTIRCPRCAIIRIFRTPTIPGRAVAGLPTLDVEDDAQPLRRTHETGRACSSTRTSAAFPLVNTLAYRRDACTHTMWISTSGPRCPTRSMIRGRRTISSPRSCGCCSNNTGSLTWMSGLFYYRGPQRIPAAEHVLHRDGRKSCEAGHTHLQRDGAERPTPWRSSDRPPRS